MPKNKYHAKKAYRQIDGKTVVFDSQKEANRWDELCLLQSAGKIHGLKRQVRFVLLPVQRQEGKVVERETSYIADFCYYQDGQMVVEDTKGMKTPDYIIKRKLMLYEKGIRVHEV